jgi:hypothetical protein
MTECLNERCLPQSTNVLVYGLDNLVGKSLNPTRTVFCKPERTRYDVSVKFFFPHPARFSEDSFIEDYISLTALRIRTMLSKTKILVYVQPEIFFFLVNLKKYPKNIFMIFDKSIAIFV